MGRDPLAEEIRKKIIHKLVTRIEVLPETFRVHFHVGENYVEGELAQAEESLSSPLGSPLAGLPKRRNSKSLDLFKPSNHFFCNSGSNLLENGVPELRSLEPLVLQKRRPNAPLIKHLDWPYRTGIAFSTSRNYGYRNYTTTPLWHVVNQWWGKR